MDLPETSEGLPDASVRASQTPLGEDLSITISSQHMTTYFCRMLGGLVLDLTWWLTSLGLLVTNISRSEAAHQ